MSELLIPKYTFHPTTRTLNNYCLKSLGAIVTDLHSNPSLPKQIHTINILEDEAFEDDYDDKYGEDRFLSNTERGERDSKTSLGISQHMATIMDLIQAESGLKEFAWENLFHKSRDSPLFWRALWRSFETLEKLNLVFGTHEIHDLRELAGPPEKFIALRTLRIDAHEAHGDNAIFLIKILHASPVLESLELILPSCDLKECCIQNMAWDFSFPFLKSFILHGYSPNDATFSTFLFRHPGIFFERRVG